MHINSSEHILLLLCVCACSVVSNSLWPYELQPSRLLCPWDFPGKSPEVGCHSPLQDIFQTLGSNPMALASPMLAGEFFTTESPGKPILWCWCKKRILVFFLRILFYLPFWILLFSLYKTHWSHSLSIHFCQCKLSYSQCISNYKNCYIKNYSFVLFVLNY